MKFLRKMLWHLPQPLQNVSNVKLILLLLLFQSDNTTTMCGLERVNPSLLGHFPKIVLCHFGYRIYFHAMCYYSGVCFSDKIFLSQPLLCYQISHIPKLRGTYSP